MIDYEPQKVWENLRMEYKMQKAKLNDFLLTHADKQPDNILEHVVRNILNNISASLDNNEEIGNLDAIPLIEEHINQLNQYYTKMENDPEFLRLQLQDQHLHPDIVTLQDVLK